MSAFTADYRIYYEDTDAGGIVYYANYMKFAERGRTEALRTLGFENSALAEREGVLFVVRHLEADYLRPARLDDIITVKTAIAGTSRASFTMDQVISCGEVMLFHMRVKLACINLQGRPARLPDHLRQMLDGHIIG